MKAVAFCLLVSLSLRAQLPTQYLPVVQQYSVEQGLNNRFVRDVFQDSRGFIWLSTHFGLNRFDGHTFTAYTVQSHGLRSNVIAAVREDPDGWLWVFQMRDAEIGYLQLLDPRTGQVQEFEEHFGRRLPFNLLDLGSYRGGQNPRFLFLKDGTLFRYVGGGRFVRSFPGPLNALQATGRGTFRASFFDAQAFPYRHRDLDSSGQVLDPNAPPPGPVWPLQPGQPVWLQVPETPDLTLRDFGDARRGCVWHLDVGTRQLLVRRTDGTLLHDFSPELAQFEGWQGVYCVLLDRTGSLWLATGDGVLLLNLVPNRFTTLLQQPATASETWISVRAMHLRDNTLWVNSQGGLYRLPSASRRHASAPPTDPAAHPTSTAVYAQFTDRHGNLWLGGPTLDLLPNRQLPQRTFILKHPHVWAIAEHQGLLWMGTEHGLTQFDPVQLREREFTGYGPFGELAEAKVTAFQPDPDGSWWVCASSGLYRFDPQRRLVTDRYHVGGDAAHRLPFDFLHFILPDRHEPGAYWLATKGAGLVRWHRPTGQTQVFARTEGLSNELLHAVYDDDRGGLWLPSDRGLMRFDKRSHTVRAFFEKDGIAHDEFNVTAHHRDADGRLYFGGLNGVTTFHPADFYKEKSEAPPRLAVASLRRQDARTGRFSDQSAQFWADDAVELTPNERTAQLAVCLPDFRQPAYHTFAYRLRGLQESWVYQPDNVVTLSGLPSGRYTLEIRAQNAVGEWTTTPLHIPVRMLPPVYLRWWFLLGLALAVTAAGVGLSRLRTRALRRENDRLETEVATRTEKIRQQADELQELDRLKTRFFANVSHELRTPLTLILGSYHLVRKVPLPEVVRHSLDVAERNAAVLLRQVNQLLDLNRLEAQRLERHDRPLALKPFLARVVGQFESQAERLGQRLAFDDRTPGQLTLLLDSEKLGTILVNLLANALKYTPPGGRITLRAEEADDGLRLTVEDTGRGIHPDDLPRVFDRFFQTAQVDAPAEGGSGIGLSLVKELTDLLGGTVTVRSEVGRGSVFVVRLPSVPTPPEDLSTPGDEPLPREEPAGRSGPSVGEQPGESSSRPGTPPPGGLPRPRVLLVEDHPDMRAYVAQLLAEDFDVETLPDGAQALERLRAPDNPPDLVLSDRMMPGIDGLQLLQKIRRETPFPLLPFVMLTARAAEADRLEALHVGVDDYLTKPFNPDELRARVRNLIANARLRRAFLAETAASDPVAPVPDEETFLLDWLKKAERVARQHLANSHFGTIDLADELALSERQLARRLRGLTGLTPNQYLQEIRLQVAREYFETHPGGTWKEASLTVGFHRSDYLRKLYAERFGGGGAVVP